MYFAWRNWWGIVSNTFEHTNSHTTHYKTDTNTGKTTVTNGSTDKTKVDKTNYIGEEKAKEIAISRVSGAKRSDVVRIKLDKENGRVVYEGKILYNYTEYKFDIDALTGEILSWEVNRD